MGTTVKPTEIGLKWWRVELDRDGGIKTVVEVEESTKGSRLVCFVQATTRADACSLAAIWYHRRLEQQRKHQRRHYERHKGACKQCGDVLHANSSWYCARHHQLNKESSQRSKLRQSGVEVPLRRIPVTDPAATKARIMEGDRQRSRMAKRLHATVVLKQFDLLGPAKFREWLVGTIESHKIRDVVPEVAAAE